ncbi:MAG: DUF1918 domain-containing protein [Frankiaceae bacterium]
MEAKAGDRLVVRGPHVDDPNRAAEILEVRGPGGRPPFLVKWSGGAVGLCFPGPDAYVEHREG